MKCIQCEGKQIESEIDVTEHPARMTGRTYYDKDGIPHNHYVMHQKVYYICTNDHSWENYTSTQIKCPSCDYGSFKPLPYTVKD